MLGYRRTIYILARKYVGISYITLQQFDICAQNSFNGPLSVKP